MRYAVLPGGRVPIVNYVYNQAPLNFYRTELDCTPGLLESYARRVGPYPFASKKYHSLAPPGGVEHQTRPCAGPKRGGR